MTTKTKDVGVDEMRTFISGYCESHRAPEGSCDCPVYGNLCEGKHPEFDNVAPELIACVYRAIVHVDKGVRE